jgi:gliding motility-associated-like protein
MTSNNPCANPATVASNAVNMTVSPAVPGIRYQNVTATPNTSFPLHARSLGNSYSYQWTPPVGLNFYDVKDPLFTYDKQTQYLIRMMSTTGCVTIDTLLVNVGTEPAVFVPNAWSPNGDGHNDYLFPLTINVVKINYFRVFNRWGQEVFETNIIGSGWDGNFRGKAQPMDVYTWTLEAVGTGGHVYKSSGRAVLMR